MLPQDARLTVYWRLGAGFTDGVRVEVLQGERTVYETMIAAEVNSLAIDKERVRLQNGTEYTVRVATYFAGLTLASKQVRVRPACLGEERACNAPFEQTGLVYRYSTLAPEADCFGDAPVETSTNDQAITCGQCNSTVTWDGSVFACSQCRSEYVPNGMGAYLNVGALRFGTCKCCSPRKILIQRMGQEALHCAHSQKEHLRDGARFLLIEDLPHGLCECCRPRRPLAESGGEVRCSKSAALHRREGSSYALEDNVFDASSIDALLDAGLAEISSTGITRRR